MWEVVISARRRSRAWEGLQCWAWTSWCVSPGWREGRQEGPVQAIVLERSGRAGWGPCDQQGLWLPSFLKQKMLVHSASCVSGPSCTEGVARGGWQASWSQYSPPLVGIGLGSEWKKDLPELRMHQDHPSCQSQYDRYSLIPKVWDYLDDFQRESTKSCSSGLLPSCLAPWLLLCVYLTGPRCPVDWANTGLDVAVEMRCGTWNQCLDQSTLRN
jgi:hypothetical protein